MPTGFPAWMRDLCLRGYQYEGPEDFWQERWMSYFVVGEIERMGDADTTWDRSNEADDEVLLGIFEIRCVQVDGDWDGSAPPGADEEFNHFRFSTILFNREKYEAMEALSYLRLFREGRVQQSLLLPCEGLTEFEGAINGFLSWKPALPPEAHLDTPEHIRGAITSPHRYYICGWPSEATTMIELILKLGSHDSKDQVVIGGTTFDVIAGYNVVRGSRYGVSSLSVKVTGKDEFGEEIHSFEDCEEAQAALRRMIRRGSLRE